MRTRILGATVCALLATLGGCERQSGEDTPAPGTSNLLADPVRLPSSDPAPHVPLPRPSPNAHPAVEGDAAQPSADAGPCGCPPGDPLCTCL